MTDEPRARIVAARMKLRERFLSRFEKLRLGATGAQRNSGALNHDWDARQGMTHHLGQFIETIRSRQARVRG
jgi:hypothetical protein